MTPIIILSFISNASTVFMYLMFTFRTAMPNPCGVINQNIIPSSKSCKENCTRKCTNQKEYSLSYKSVILVNPKFLFVQLGRLLLFFFYGREINMLTSHDVNIAVSFPIFFAGAHITRHCLCTINKSNGFYFLSKTLTSVS